MMRMISRKKKKKITLKVRYLQKSGKEVKSHQYHIQLDLEDSATFAENLYCAFSCPNWYFLLLFCFSFVNCLIASRQRPAAQAQRRRIVEKLEGVMWFHIGTGVVLGKLPSEQVSLYCQKEGKNQNEVSGLLVNYTQQWFCSFLAVFRLYPFGAVSEPQVPCWMAGGEEKPDEFIIEKLLQGQAK